MIVKAPDDQSVLFDKASLSLVNTATEVCRFVVVVIKGWLVDDKQVIARFVRALTDVESRTE